MTRPITALAASACLTLLVLACQPRNAATVPEDDAAPGEPAEVAAEVGGVAITTVELDERIKEDLFQSRAGNPSKLHELREGVLEQLVLEQIVEAEASRRGVGSDELIRIEVEALGPVTEEDVSAFYEENRDKLGGATLEQVADRIRTFLEAQRENQAVAALRERAEVTIHLEPPRLAVKPDGPSRGPEGARVTIVEFSDFQCPYCKRVLPTLDTVLKKYPEDVRLVYRHLPLRSHRRARPAAEAALCAGEQDEFWPYHDKLFENPRALEDEDLFRYAGELELDAERFEQCYSEKRFADQVDADLQEARSVGISSTPTFVVNGVVISGAKPVEAFTRVIDAELARADEG
jgi:protein-disulfide isomerase